MQKPDSNRHITPYEGAALPIGPFCNNCGHRSRTCYLQCMRLKWYSVPLTRQARTGNRTRIICLEGRCACRYTTRTKASNGTRTRKSALAERRVANYAILAYESFPSDSNRQPADYETAALPLRQRSLIGAAGIEPASSAYKTGALPLDEAPEAGTAGIEPAAFCLTDRRSAD